MAWSLPRLLRRAGAALVHTQYAVPLRAPVPGRRDRPRPLVRARPTLMRPPRPARLPPRRASGRRGALPACSRSRERTQAGPRRALRRRPRRASSSPRTASTPPSTPAPTLGTSATAYVARGRRDPAAQEPARGAGGGPRGRARRSSSSARRRTRRLAAELRRGGARLEGYVPIERLAELYRGAACLVQASRYEGFGLPVLEAMASGTPVVTVRDAGARRGRGRRGRRRRPEDDLADGIRSALAERDRLAAAGLERARAFSLARRRPRRPSRSTARRSADERLRRRRLARARGRARALAARARAAGGRARRDRERARLGRRACRAASRVLENARPLSLRRERQPRHRRHHRRVRPRREPGRRPRARRGRRPRGVRRRRARAAASPGRRSLWPDGTWQPSRRRFPTVRGTLVRRTPLRLLFPPFERQRAHYLPRRATRRAGRGRLAARRLPAHAADDARRARRLGRAATATTARTSTSATAPMQGGLGALVRPAGGRAARLRGRDRPALPLAPHALARARAWLRFVRKHPERLPRACERAAQGRPVRPQGVRAGRTSEYADARTYLAHRARARRRRSGPRSRRATRCSTSPAATAASASTCSGAACATAASTRAGDGRGGAAPPRRRGRTRAGRPEHVRARRPGRRDDRVPGDLLRRRPPGVLRARRGLHGAQARLRPQPAAVPRSRTSSPTCAPPGFDRVALRPFFVPQTLRAAARRRPRALRALERSGPLARLALRVRFTYLVAAVRG